MGFLNKLRDRVRSQIQPGNMPTDRQNAFVNPIRPGMSPQLPVGLIDANGYIKGDDRYGGGFTRGPGDSPGMIKDPPRGGFPNMPNLPGKRPSSPPPIRPRTRPSLLPRVPKKLGIPSLPQNLDFLSRLPPNMMPEVDFSNLPQMAGNPNIPAPDGYELRENEKGMNYFREQLSPEDQAQNMLPRRLDIPFQDFNLKNMRPGFFGGRDVNIDDGGMVDFLNSDPQQKLFGIETRIGILQNQLKEAETNRDRESFDMIVQEINNADAQRIEIMNSMKPNPINQDFQQRGFDQGRTISDLDDILSSLEKKN